MPTDTLEETMAEIEKQYRIAEAADLLGLKEATVRKWILLRRIGYRKIGGAVRIPAGEIARRLAGNYTPAREERQ